MVVVSVEMKLRCYFCITQFCQNVIGLNGKMTNTRQNSYSISHLLGTVTTQCVVSDGVVTVDNCRQHDDYIVDQLCSITVLPAINDDDYTVTVKSLCSHCV